MAAGATSMTVELRGVPGGVPWATNMEAVAGGTNMDMDVELADGSFARVGSPWSFSSTMPAARSASDGQCNSDGYTFTPHLQNCESNYLWEITVNSSFTVIPHKLVHKYK